MDPPETKHQELIHRPEELVYRSCYVPVDLGAMLLDPDSRARIRRLPPAQLFFSAAQLSDEEVVALLPYVTEEQWTAILDLDLWERDRADLGSFLNWERHLLAAEDAVVRKLLRATDPELWEYSFSRELQIFRRLEEDEFEGEPSGEAFVTPDGAYLVGLPKPGEKGFLYRQLLLKLYQIDADWARFLLEEARFRTPSELEENAFEERRRRIEDLGFQDYYDAIELYTPLSATGPLPEKRWDPIEMAPLPIPVKAFGEHGPMLLVQALAALPEAGRIEPLVEEIFYVCNRLLSADRVAPADPARVKRGIRKALSGINLGLSVWSGGDLARAAWGIRKHYLASYFQIGLDQLWRLRTRAEALVQERAPEPGSYPEALLNGLRRRYPRLTVKISGRLRRKYIGTHKDFARTDRFLSRLER